MVTVEARQGAKVGTWGGSAEVAADGTHEFSGVPAGEYRLTSRPNPGSGNKPYVPEQIIKLNPGETVTVKFVYP